MKFIKVSFFCLNPFLGNTFTSGAHAAAGLR